MSGLASINMKANTQGAVPLLTQACIVPRLDDDIAGFQMCHLAAVELEVAFAR